MPNVWDVEVEDGTITTPGKFEGQRAYITAMYDVWLEGFADDDQIVVDNQAVDCITVAINDDDRRLWPELAHRKYVKFRVTDDGFVQEVGHGEQY